MPIFYKLVDSFIKYHQPHSLISGKINNIIDNLNHICESNDDTGGTGKLEKFIDID